MFGSGGSSHPREVPKTALFRGKSLQLCCPWFLPLGARESHTGQMYLGLIAREFAAVDSPVTRRYFCFSVNNNATSLCRAKRKSSTRVQLPSTICPGNCPTKLWELPSLTCALLSGVTSNSLLMRVRDSSNRSGRDEKRVSNGG